MKLSDTQRRILKVAAKEPKADVREHMKDLKSPAIQNKVLESMIKHGLVAEDPDAEGVTYVISEAGYAAIGKKPPAPAAQEDTTDPETEAEVPVKKREPKPKREGASKKQVMIDMLSCDEGTTMQQLMEATGWLKHSVHGGMANLKKEIQEKRGQTIVGTKDDGESRVYKIVSYEPAEEAAAKEEETVA